MFNHHLFFPYLALTALIYWLLPSRRIRNGFLTLCSLAAIWYLDPQSVAVVVGMTVFTYLAAGWIERGKNPKLAFRTGIFGLLAIIVIFKYLGLLTATLNSLTAFVSFLPVFRIEKLFLPLGISYITFKYISYLSDVRSGVVKQGRWLDFACYGSLFTIFVAGPIERFETLKPQLESEDCSFRDEYLNTALERMLFGMFKKLVLADWLALVIQPVWQSPELFSLSARVLALMGFSMQIYFDFSGYSDVAIGASRLYGFKIGENFNYPYMATNITQFWQRWHISLSNWIRIYLFFPLSLRSRNRFWILFCVPVISMSICGIWHGPAWHFALWGIWHGLGIAIHQLWSSFRRRNKEISTAMGSKWLQFPGLLLTFAFVSVGWLIFGVNTLRLAAAFFAPYTSRNLSMQSTLMIVCGLFMMFGWQRLHIYLQGRLAPRYYRALRWAGIFVLIWLVITFFAESSPFRYAGF
jgi:D-alanyl-lipoteichoic acid acyltransferase DltB (MBOAT superfamily)